jgi:hypothetical protein
VQLLGTRLTVQNARLQSAIHDHEAARAALQHDRRVGRVSWLPDGASRLATAYEGAGEASDQVSLSVIGPERRVG